MHTNFIRKISKAEKNFEYFGVDGITLKLDFIEIWCESGEWIQLAADKFQKRAGE
jgi:hypothetical protein